MDALIAVNAETETVAGDLIEDALAEFDDVFLLRFLTGGIVENLAHDAGITGPQHIVFGYSDKVSNSKAGHKEIVTIRRELVL